MQGFHPVLKIWDGVDGRGSMSRSVVGVQKGVFVLGVVSGNVHKRVCGSRLPPSNTLVWSVTKQLSFVYVTACPASQNQLVEMRDAVARPPMMWAAVTWAGMPGMSKCPMCVNLSCELSGNVAMIGAGSSCLCRMGALLVMKWHVVPESLMATVASMIVHTALATCCGGVVWRMG